MTAYSGQAITYDAIGNPLAYRDGMTMTWKNGRQLATLQDSNNTISYSYDSNSVRVKKNVNGTEYTYAYVNGLLMYETRGTARFFYSYDSNGILYSVKYTLTDSSSPLTYYYTHNSRGDIVGIYNEAGELMAHYEYDAWGNVLSVTDQNGNAITSATHIGNLNPFRYRGYYLDTETGLYYLMSRYYDPVVHRFINADGYFQAGGSILDANMSAYCGNNPVSRSDSTGERYEQYGAAGGGFYVSGGGYGGGSFSSSGSSALIAAGVAILSSEIYREAKRDHILAKNSSKSSSNSTVSTPSSSDSYCVYGLSDNNGIKYVGRTKNKDAREKYHKHDVLHGRNTLKFVELKDNLTLNQARGLEQAYMLHYHTLRKGDYPYNQINGIRWDNDKKEDYVFDALGYLDNVISNELLNWAGL